MDKESVAEIAEQLGLVSKDIMFLLSEYQYYSGIITIISTLFFVLSTICIVIIAINHYKTTCKTDEDNTFHTIYAIASTVFVLLFSMLMAEQAKKIIVPKGYVANSIVQALKGRQ